VSAARAWCGLNGQEPGIRLLVDPNIGSHADINWWALLPDDRLTGWLSADPRHFDSR
jgi:hypothetical protein